MVMRCGDVYITQFENAVGVWGRTMSEETGPTSKPLRGTVLKTGGIYGDVADVKTHTVTGSGDIDIRVNETGDEDGQPILFVHGFSMSRLVWDRQLRSDLADDYRLVTLNVRGHGLSDKPEGEDAYADPKLWADDIEAVIKD